VRYRTRTLLTGAALTLLAAGFSAGLGASNAVAAHAKPSVHKISACGYVATAPGTYELTKSLTASGSGTCITLRGDNISLYLDGHTITGTATDTCVWVDVANGYQSVNDSVVGGTTAKPTLTATLTNCAIGLYVYYTSGTTASHLKIESPTAEGVFEEHSTGTTLSNISVPMQTSAAYGFFLTNGADNVVTKSTVDNNSTAESYLVEYETGDSFTHDSAVDTYSAGGNAGYGFIDEYSSRNTYSYDTSTGYADGFYLYPDLYGPITATHDTATASTTYPAGYGFYIYYASAVTDTASPFHTLVSHNKTNGFKWGFYDYTDSASAVAERWIDNTAHNYSGYGFYIFQPTDYVMTGNTADANTAGKKYSGGSMLGFYFENPASQYAFAKFANNAAYDNEFGFYSNDNAVGGKGNIAKRNKYNSYKVEITG